MNLNTVVRKGFSKFKVCSVEKSIGSLSSVNFRRLAGKGN